MSRKLWILTSCLLVVAMLLAACQPAAAPTTAAPTAAPQAEEPTAAPQANAEPTQAPEATTAAEPAQSELAPVTIKWTLDGAGVPKDIDAVEEHLNNLPQLKAINTTVKLEFYDWGSYDQKTQLMFTSGEECDLIFTSNWANNYVNGAINGNYIALDDLLPKYAPKTWKEVSQVAWTMSKVNGKIYAIPNQQLWYNAWGFQIRKDVADQYKVDLSKLNSYEDLTPLMESVLKDHPEWKYQLVQGSGPFVAGTMGYDGMPGGFGAIKQGDNSRKIVNLNAEPIMMDRIKLWRDWEQKGLAPQEVVDYATADAARKNGFYPFKLHVEKPGVSAEDKMIYGVGDWVAKPLEKPVLGYILPTMTGVCATSKNPERALMFFDLMYSDPEVYNTVANGVEGKHWVWVDKEKKVIGFPEGIDPKNSGWNINVDWMIGNVFISYYKNVDQVGAWDETRKVNNEAVLPMMGPFVFDPTPVQSELAALTTIDKQFEPLIFGLVDPMDPEKGWDAWIKAEKEAGADKVIAEEQKQLDAFIAANPDIFK